MAILISWAAAAVKLRISALTTLLYPIAITCVLYTAVTSYIGIRRGTMTWKDRAIGETDEAMVRDLQVTKEERLNHASDTPASNSES